VAPPSEKTTRFPLIKTVVGVSEESVNRDAICRMCAVAKRQTNWT